jgi:hypothetical protein
MPRKKITLKQVQLNLKTLRRRSDSAEDEFKKEFQRINDWVQIVGTDALGIDNDLSNLMKMYYAANVHRNLADFVEKTQYSGVQDMHPFAFPDNDTGALGMKSGQTLIDNEGNICTADEFLTDGEVFVSYPDGSYSTLKWTQVRPPTPEEMDKFNGQNKK